MTAQDLHGIKANGLSEKTNFGAKIALSQQIDGAARKTYWYSGYPRTMFPGCIGEFLRSPHFTVQLFLRRRMNRLMPTMKSFGELSLWESHLTVISFKNSSRTQFF